MDYPEIIENAAQLRDALSDHVEPYPWLTWTRLDIPSFQPVTGFIPEPLAPPLPMWVEFTDGFLEDYGAPMVGFLGSNWPDPERDRDNQTPLDVIRQPRVPIAAEPTDLLNDRAAALFGRLSGARTITLAGCVQLLRAAVVLRRIAERCTSETERWSGQRVVTRKLAAEATTYDAVADQYEAAAVDSTRFWWSDYRARAQAASEADGGPAVIEPIPIRLS